MLFFLFFCPPLSELSDFAREFFSGLRESVGSLSFTFFYDTRFDEFPETISKDLGIGFADIFPDLCEAMMTARDRIHDKYIPLLSEK
jgi:hypothetical protein